MNMLLVFLRAVVARRLAGYDAWATGKSLPGWRHACYCGCLCLHRCLTARLVASASPLLLHSFAAPPCSKAPVGSSKSDSNGRLWGAENGNSCAYKVWVDDYLHDGLEHLAICRFLQQFL